MNKLTVIDIFRLYFQKQTESSKYFYIHSYDIERQLVAFGNQLGVMHTAETYVRAFREIRERNLLKDFEIQSEKIPGKRTLIFKIKRLE